uniref:Uncharacterized protein n=1 Tax=viral metagenome TaxID=1070528 RepID=A0A6C0IAH6_9ZZZZ
MNILAPLRRAEHLPFYFISFHGIYYAPNQLSQIVPKDSYLLETCDPGEISYNTIDNYIWQLCNFPHREQFLHCLSKHSSEPCLNKYEAAVRSLIIHLPNTPYATRHHTTQVGPGGRGFFQGIYKFSNTTQYSEAHPPTNANTHYKDFVNRLIQTRAPTTNTEIMEMIRINDPDASNGAVFIFVSCGACSSKMSKPDINTLQTFIQQKKLSMMALHDGIARYSPGAAAEGDTSHEEFIEEDSLYERKKGRFKRLKKEVKQLKKICRQRRF